MSGEGKLIGGKISKLVRIPQSNRRRWSWFHYLPSSFFNFHGWVSTLALLLFLFLCSYGNPNNCSWSLDSNMNLIAISNRMSDPQRNHRNCTGVPASPNYAPWQMHTQWAALDPLLDLIRYTAITVNAKATMVEDILTTAKKFYWNLHVSSVRSLSFILQSFLLFWKINSLVSLVIIKRFLFFFLLFIRKRDST